MSNTLKKIQFKQFKPSDILEKLRIILPEDKASLLSIYLHNNGLPKSVNLFAYNKRVTNFLAKSNLNLETITETRISNLNLLLENLSKSGIADFEIIEQKLVKMIQYANNPYCILDGLSKLNNNLPAQTKLFNSFDNTLHRALDDTKQWIKGKNNSMVKWNQRSGNKDYPYEKFHCKKGDNFCIVYNINGTIIEFMVEGTSFSISQVGNIAKSDEVYEFLSTRYSKFKEIIENEN